MGLNELASTGTLFAGLMLALLLGLAKKPAQAANLFLSGALSVILLKTDGLAALFFPAFGPLLYFYVKQQTRPNNRFCRKDILHFCPLPAAYWIPTPLIPISVIIYLYLAHRLIQDFYRSLRPVLMDRPRFVHRRLDKALFLLGLLCTLSLINDVFYLTVAVVLMVMAADAILKPDDCVQLAAPISERTEAKEKSRRLREAVAVNRFYEDPELTLTTLAVKLLVHPQDLSRLINMGLQKNFSDFINEFRVREVARKIQDPAYDRLSLLGIAYASGFNSKRTFNRVFKDMTGSTPLAYKNSLKKEGPIHKLALPAGIPPLLLRPEGPSNRAPENLKRNYMFKNYFKTAFRNLLRHRIYSLINIAGLSAGLACAMLILLYVQDEVSYDRFHKNASHIYRIDKQVTRADGSIANGSYTGYFPGPRFSAKIPEIQSFVRFQPAQADIKTGRDIQSQAVFFVDANFFSVFSFPLLSGNAGSVLSQPNSVVINEEIALKYFGSSDVAGKTISIKQDSVFRPYIITGVAKNCPQNSSIKFQVLLPLKVSAGDESNNNNWFNSFLSTFIVLSPGADLEAVKGKMDNIFASDASEAISQIKRTYKVKNIGIAYVLEPLTAIHLGKLVPEGDEMLRDKSNPEFSYILSGIAIFVLLIACINFVNLTLARSVKRAKEIGIRKVIGGTSKQLRIQFLTESFILCLIAFLVAIAIVIMVLPVFSQLANKVLSLSYLFKLKMIICYTGLFLVTGFLAGFYPSMVLSDYHPVETLYSRFNFAGKNYLQKTLVIFQFALASFLIIGATAFFLQFNFLTSQNLGYDDTNLITVNKFSLTRNEALLFKQELMKNSDIEATAAANDGDNNNTVKTSGDKQVNIAVETIDAAYLPLLKIPVMAGRNFSAEYPSDSKHSALVNEAFVQQAGWKRALGEQIKTFAGETYTVIGVVKNYHYKPLTEKITPQFFSMDPSISYGVLYIKLKPNTATLTLPYISNTFKRLFPLSPFIYTFKEEQHKMMYAAEARWKAIILFSAVLTIFISCIGLLGLSVLAAEKRVKEIGVRKVLGASLSSILRILSADFLQLILISLAISIPLAWLVISKWLQSYPYRITLNLWLFAAGGLSVLLIALITIGFQSIRAATANPVKSLRNE